MANSNNHSNKEAEEIKKLKAETKALISQRYFEILKSIVLFIGAIVLFIFIQRPESILNQKSSQESISRERAKLLLDLLKEEDPQKISIGISIIKASYPDSDKEWIKNIEATFQIQSNIKMVDSLTKRFESLTLKREKYLTLYFKEISGENSGQVGIGPRATILQQNISAIDFELDEIKKQLEIYKVNVK